MRVVKVGGRVQTEAALPAALASLWRDAPGSACVVHGGGEEVTALQRRLGIEPTFVNGRRATSERDIELLRMALSGAANKRLVGALTRAGAMAVGLSGEDAGLLVARAVDRAALGLVGRVESVNAVWLRHLLDGGALPVISPLACDADAAGGPGALNVNADDAAAAVAVALSADELLLLADVSGVLVAGAPLRELDAVDAGELIAAGAASAGMVAKLEAGIAAVEGGVARVRVGDLGMLADPQRGTLITPIRSYA